MPKKLKSEVFKYDDLILPTLYEKGLLDPPVNIKVEFDKRLVRIHIGPRTIIWDRKHKDIVGTGTDLR